MLRCLLVTADAVVRDMVKVGLEQTQLVDVEFVEDAWALEMAKSEPFEIVIAEYSLADGSDGVELLAQIRSELPDAELLLITRTRTQSRYLAREKQTLGIYGFVHVPIDPVEFFRTIARLLDRIQTRSTA